MFVRAIAASFPSFTGRSRAVLSSVRSLLLLEDDANVDWEVDQERADVSPHPHRERLVAASRRHRARRAGQPPAAEQVCLSPLRGPGQPGLAAPASITARRLDVHRPLRSRSTRACAAPER
jgi:hypothetical protein